LVVEEVLKVVAGKANGASGPGEGLLDPESALGFGSSQRRSGDRWFTDRRSRWRG